MGFLPAERADAVALYTRLGLDVFPYDTRSVPFTGWSSPALWAPAYRTLLDKVHTFGVRLDEHVCVIDIDADRGGRLADIEYEFGSLPPTLTVVSPSGPSNLHLMFKTSVPLRTSKGLAQQFKGIDFMAAGSHVKGATSIRYLNTGEEVAYKLQRPVIDPAPLPAALEHEWARLQPASEDRLWDQIIGDGISATPRVRMKAEEDNNVRKRIRDALRKIRGAGKGNRHDVLYRNARDIYQAAVLRGESMQSYDKQIAEAYARPAEKTSQNWTGRCARSRCGSQIIPCRGRE